MPRLDESRSASVMEVSSTQRMVARSTGAPFASRISSSESSGEPSRLAFTSKTSFSPLRAWKRKSFSAASSLPLMVTGTVIGLRLRRACVLSRSGDFGLIAQAPASRG